MNTRRSLLGALLAAGAAPGLAAAAGDHGETSAGSDAFAGATGWLNSVPLTDSGLRGKVVLVDFCTYSCINWLRSLPYVRAWSEKYKALGLVVIGVHTPEFEFEKELAHVRRAISETKVDYPVAVDSARSIWRAFRNEYWPAVYLIDARGRLRHRHFGEGEYAQTERVIQQLLTEAGAQGVGTDLVAVEPRGIEAAADWARLRSPENYVGFGRTQNFASPGGTVNDKRRVYASPARLKLNQWALSGDWRMEQQRVVSSRPEARITTRFEARDVHLVMGPALAGQPARYRVRLDGAAPGADHGLDVDEHGLGVATWPRLHQLVRQARPVADRLVEIEFLDAPVNAYSFTFG